MLSGAVQYISEAFIRQDLLEILLGMLKDEVIEVKLSSIRNFHFFYKYLDLAVVKEKVISEFKILCHDKNWKIRFEVLKCVPHFLADNKLDLIAEFVYFNEQLRDDHIHCIRERITQNLIDCYRKELSSELDVAVADLVGYWSSLNNYIFRVSCLQMLARFIGILNIEVFHRLLSSTVEKLKNDKVANVRLNVLKLVDQMMKNTDREFRREFVEPILQEYKEDRDPDISYTLELIREQMLS